MTSAKAPVAALRVSLVVLFGVLLLLQVMSLPGQFAHMAEQDPDQAHLRWPLTAISVLLVLCVQVVVVATWVLLRHVEQDRIFEERSFAWVDVIIGAIGVGWVILAGVLLAVGLTADDPGAPLLLFLVVVGVTVLGLLMVVMRALLRRATLLRADLDGVI